MKKAIWIISISIMILALFRGIFYRLIVNYNDIGYRTTIAITNQELIDNIKQLSANSAPDIYEIAEISDIITRETLSFHFGNSSNDPNALIDTKQANCVGYSALFNSVANYLIAEHDLQDEIKAVHKIGQLDFLGIDIHQFSDNPFYKDHDYNEIINIKTDEIIAIDPTVSDYLRIKTISTNH